MTNPKQRFDECEDFFILVVESYVLASSMLKFGMKSLEDTPSTDVVPEDVWLQSKDDRKKIINELSAELVDSFVDFQSPDEC